ncbi:MAG: hypothetical protein KDI11_04240 [Alphaproteobacteria bacterium]|nr:hypothetical protein [Alphaproteobacteria bacterium]
MRIRSLVSSVAVLGAFLASSALVGDALAQKGTIMAPSTGWAVSKIGDVGGAYCALARKYNQDTVLTMARNEFSETSFALDFQRPILNQQAAMKVILDPGAGQQRAYEIKPVSDKAFVVRLGRDSSFFDALARTGLLRVEMDGQSYHFNVADIDEGQFKLDACVVNMVMPAAGEDGALMPDMDAAVVNAGKSFRQEINALRRQITSLEEQNAALKVQMSTRNEGVEETSSSVVQLSGKIRELEDANALLKRQLSAAQTAQAGESLVGSDVQALESKIVTLENENARLQALLQTGEAVQSSHDLERITALEAEVQSLQARNGSLQTSLDAQGEGKELVDGLRSQIEELESENTQLSTKILAAREAVRSEFEQQIAALNNENAALKTTAGSKGVDAELLEQLRHQIAQVQNENRLLQETAAKAQGDLEIQFREEQKNAVEEVRNEQAVRIAGLENEVDALKAEGESKAKALTEISEGTAELATLRDENAALKEKLALQEAQHSQSDVMITRIENLETENEGLRAQLNVAQQSFSAGSDAAEADAHTHVTRIAALESERDDLKALVAQSEESVARIRTLESEVARLEGVNSDLQTQIAAGDVQEQLQGVLAENAKLLKQNQNKDLQLSELGQVRQELKDSKAKIVELQGRVEGDDKASMKIEELETRQGEMKAALADLVKLSEKYRDSIVQQKERIGGFERDVAALTVEKSELEIALAAAEQKLENVEPVLHEAQSLSDDTKKDVVQESLIAEAKARPVQAVVSEKARVSFGPVVRSAHIDVPVPAQKPVVQKPVVKAAQRSEIIGELDVVPVSEPEEMLQKNGIALALEQVETEMRITDPNNQARMQVLVQEYEALKAFAEEQGVEVIPSEAAMVEDSDDKNVYPDLGDVNEAQRQEHMMKMYAEDAYNEDEWVVEGLDLKATLEPESIAMSQSADPFEDMQVDHASKIELAAQGVDPHVAMESMPTLYAGVRSGALSITDLITQAKVSSVDKIEKIDEGAATDAVAYQWSDDSIYGSAEQKTLSSSLQFDEMVQAYLERTQSRCPGEFAVVPDDTIGDDNMRVDSYEVACVGADTNSGASLLFFNQGETFTVVAHEVPTEALGKAMVMRNKVMRFIIGS